MAESPALQRPYHRAILAKGPPPSKHSRESLLQVMFKPYIKSSQITPLPPSNPSHQDAKYLSQSPKINMPQGRTEVALEKHETLK